MDKVKKAISRLSKEYKTAFDFLMERLFQRNVLGLDIKRLRGHQDIFRLRHGKLRVIFQLNKEKLEVLDVGLRNENTYRNF